MEAIRIAEYPSRFISFIRCLMMLINGKINGYLTIHFIVPGRERKFNRWGFWHNRSVKSPAQPFPLKELLLTSIIERISVEINQSEMCVRQRTKKSIEGDLYARLYLLPLSSPLCSLTIVASLLSPPPRLRLLRCRSKKKMGLKVSKRVWNLMTDQIWPKRELNFRSLVKRWAI